MGYVFLVIAVVCLAATIYRLFRLPRAVASAGETRDAIRTENLQRIQAGYYR